MREVTDDTFEADVLNAPGPVVVDFWAPWCGPCRAVSAILAALEQQHAHRVTFAKLNVDENPAVAARYEILSLPTAILFENGEPQETVTGARRRSHYEQAWESWLGN